MFYKTQLNIYQFNEALRNIQKNTYIKLPSTTKSETNT